MEREYVILSKRCVYGAVGEVVKLKLDAGRELTMTQTGALKRAPEKISAPEPKSPPSWLAVEKEGKANG